MTPEDLNQAVTSAILKAESSHTVEDWTEVLRLERALSLQAETELEREIASRGVVSAAIRIEEAMKREQRVERDHDRYIKSLLELEGDNRRAAIATHAKNYVYNALKGALEMSTYDPTAMPWSQADHVAIMDEVRKISDKYK